MAVMDGMKTIALLRHAKSDWDAGSSSDFDRPLSVRGKLAASTMGRFIQREGAVYKKALVSPARRCVETFETACEELERPPEMALEDQIYLASAGNLLQLLQEQDDDFDSLMVVGHNPGLTFLALELIKRDEALLDRDRIAAKFPTAAFVQMECAVDRWADLGNAACHLDKRRYPVEEMI